MPITRPKELDATPAIRMQVLTRQLQSTFAAIELLCDSVDLERADQNEVDFVVSSLEDAVDSACKTLTRIAKDPS